MIFKKILAFFLLSFSFFSFFFFCLQQRITRPQSGEQEREEKKKRIFLLFSSFVFLVALNALERSEESFAPLQVRAQFSHSDRIAAQQKT
jgi:hypothetical protein